MIERLGFDNEKYLEMQSEHIRSRIDQFGGKLYLEFGGKLFDDNHASRVLPGFHPDSKIRMLMQLKDQVEIVVAVSAMDLEKSKVRGDLGITYGTDTLRLIDAFRGFGFPVGSVVLTRFSGQPAAEIFQSQLEALGLKVYRHYSIEGYPYDIPLIVSEEGYGKNEFVETTRSLVVITAPGPGSGKMAVCLSQLYHEHKRGVQAGYAKYETFPIWNLPLRHPVNLAYEAATADLNDVNMIDTFHLEAYGVTTVNYNRDVEIFPVLKTMFERIAGSSPYQSPTDMGVNMAGYCIFDDEAVCQASKEEILRRFYAEQCRHRRGRTDGTAAGAEPPQPQRGGPRLGGGRAHRRPRRRHGDARRKDSHRKDLRAAGLLLRPSAQRPEILRGHPRRGSADLPLRDRAGPGPEGQRPGQQESPPAYRRAAGGPVHLRGHRPQRQAGGAAAAEAPGLRGPHHGHSL